MPAALEDTDSGALWRRGRRGYVEQLGGSVRERTRGERADNIESAIACYQAALRVRTEAALPVDWAATQNNLGNAYSDRIRGERADNLESAIACYQAALRVYTETALPEDCGR